MEPAGARPHPQDGKGCFRAWEKEGEQQVGGLTGPDEGVCVGLGGWRQRQVGTLISSGKTTPEPHL